MGQVVLAAALISARKRWTSATVASSGRVRWIFGCKVMARSFTRTTEGGQLRGVVHQVSQDPWRKKIEASQARRELRARAIAHLGGVCTICGYNRCPSAMDFHHLEAATKDFDISARSSWKTIEPELKKCVLLCARCHREVHDGLHPKYLIDETDDRGSYD